MSDSEVISDEESVGSPTIPFTRPSRARSKPGFLKECIEEEEEVNYDPNSKSLTSLY